MIGQFYGVQFEFQRVAVIVFLDGLSHLAPLQQYSDKLSTKVVLDQRASWLAQPLGEW
jgi:hypothetical protein